MSQIFILLSYLSRNNPKYPKIITEQIFISFSLPTRKIPSIQIDDFANPSDLRSNRKEKKEGKKEEERKKIAPISSYRFQSEAHAH